jgi:hypothetical protein
MSRKRKKGSLDLQILEILMARGGYARWKDIKSDLIKKEKEDVADKVIWDSLRRLESLRDIKKENDGYHLLLPFRTIKGDSYKRTLETWADAASSQQDADERVRTLARYLYRALSNIDSLILYMLEECVEIQDKNKKEEYLDRTTKTYMNELIKRTAILLTPPKESMLPISKRTNISKQELNRAGRIITATLSREIPEKVIKETPIEIIKNHDDYSDLDSLESTFGFKTEEENGSE